MYNSYFLILGRLVEAPRGMPSTLLGRTAQRNSERLNRCKGYADVFFLIVFLNSESKKAPQHHVLRFGARTQGSPAKGEAAQKRGAPLFRIAPLAAIGAVRDARARGPRTDLGKMATDLWE